MESFDSKDLLPQNLLRYAFPNAKLNAAERFQRRCATRNELSLYRRKCSLTGKPIVALYPEDTKFPVFAQDAYWSDAWDEHASGQLWNSHEPFFSQFERVLFAAPKIAIFNTNSDNSEFCNHSVNNKNCYLCMAAVESQDCLYTRRCFYSRDCVDCFNVYRSELAYESSHIFEGYNVAFSQSIKSSNDLLFCRDCIGCHYCIGCVNLRNQEYCVFNNKVSRREYESLLAEVLGSRTALERFARKFDQFRLTQPVRALQISASDNCLGNIIDHSKNCQLSNFLKECEDCACVNFASKTVNAVDCDFIDNSSLAYESTGIEHCSGCFFSYLCVDSFDVYYSHLLVNCRNCFGCASLKNKQYCILNTQYSKEEYFRLTDEIVERMRSSTEWGEFFPGSLAIYPYEDTFAQDCFPLSSQQAAQCGFKARTADFPELAVPAANRRPAVPDSIDEVDPEVLAQVYLCPQSGRPFRFQSAELAFHKKQGICLPELHPDIRFRQRIAPFVSQRLHHRNCSFTGNKIITCYPPKSPELVCDNTAFERLVSGS